MSEGNGLTFTEAGMGIEQSFLSRGVLMCPARKHVGKKRTLGTRKANER